MKITKGTCKVCKKNKLRLCKGYIGNSPNKRFVGTNDRYWNGMTCPDCHRTKVHKNMTRFRTKVDVLLTAAAIVKSKKELIDLYESVSGYRKNSKFWG